MKKITLSCILLFYYFSLFGQDSSYRKLPETRTNVPLYLVDSKIIDRPENINPDLITDINIYKDDKVPGELKNLSRYGIVCIKTKQLIKTKTLTEIKASLNIHEKVDFFVDGFFVDDGNLLIAANSIAEIDLINDAGRITVINVWTLPYKQRHVPIHGIKIKPTDSIDSLQKKTGVSVWIR